MLLTNTACGILLRGHPDCLCKGLEEVTVIIKAGLLAGITDIDAVSEQCLGDGNASRGDVFIDGRSCRSLEDAADIRAAQIEMGREILYCDGLMKVLADVG